MGLLLRKIRLRFGDDVQIISEDVKGDVGDDLEFRKPRLPH
jgi:hypothetical protein